MAGAINTVSASDMTSTKELDLAESRYRERGYKPNFDELPWNNETENNA
jgi:hypothetical protein